MQHNRLSHDDLQHRVSHGHRVCKLSRLLKNKRPTWCHLLFYFASYVLNMFRTLIYPSSGACDYAVELPHWSYCSWFDVCWIFGVVGLEWYPCCRLKAGWRCASACNTDTIPTQPHRNSNTHRTKNNTTNVVIRQNSRKLLMMDILMSETCWAHKKRNKIASDIKLVFYSSAITMMYGPINVRLAGCICCVYLLSTCQTVWHYKCQWILTLWWLNT